LGKVRSDSFPALRKTFPKAQGGEDEKKKCTNELSK
jgi:hypothetical protein